ncbi:MAG: zinc ribbon domain-containing protein [Rhodobacteraceae bacterium]|nr:zinc ribbon domain-containing protein [Paracoccaceae bacterium]
MPIYTYRCPECTLSQEFLLPMSADDPICPTCKDATNMERQFSSKASFALKGRGWAYDGYDKNKSLRKGAPKYNDFNS